MKLLDNLGLFPKRKPEEWAQDHIKIEDIDQDTGVIITEDKRYLYILPVNSMNIALKSEEEKAALDVNYRSFLKSSAPDSFQIHCTTKVSATEDYERVFKEQRKKETSEKVKSLSESHCNFVSVFAMQQAVEHIFYFIFEYEEDQYTRKKSEQEKIEEVVRKGMELARDFSNMGNEVILPKDQYTFTCNVLYEHFNQRIKVREGISSRLDRLGHDARVASRLLETGYPSLYVKDLICSRSVNLKEDPAYVLINGMYYSYYYIDEYPEVITTDGWLTSLINLGQGYEVDLFFRKKDVAKVLTEVRRRTRLTRLKGKSADSNALDAENIEANLDSLSYARSRIKKYGDDPYDMVTVVTISAFTKESLYDKIRALEKFGSKADLTVKSLRYQQEEGYKTTAPLNYVTPDLYKMARHNITTDVVTAAYPYTSFSLRDKDGIMLGIHRDTNSLIVYNQFDTKYSNYNLTIFGESGKGKTFTLLTILERLRLLGTRCYTIAPEKQSEFARTVDQLDGVFCDISPAASTRINPFDIWVATSDNAKILEGGNLKETSWVTDKIGTLTEWIRLIYPKLTNVEKAKLENVLTRMYEKKGLTSDNDSLYIDPEKTVMKLMPTYSDFVSEMEESNEISEDIIAIFKQFVKGGAYANLDGQTNVNLDNKFIVFGMENLRGSLKAPFMYMLLKYIWAMVRRDKTENKVVAIDEGSLLIDGKSQEAGDFTAEIFKLIRGYSGSAIFATQSMADLYKKDGEFGNTILSCSHANILLGMKYSDIKFVKDSLNITDAEMNLLATFGSSQKIKGEALLCAGATHIPIIVKASEEEIEMFQTIELANLAGQLRAKNQ